MQKFSITQASLLIIGFAMGTAVILVPGLEAGVQDAWMSSLLATVPGALFLCWMLWLLLRFPGKNLIEVSQDVLGDFLGSIFGFLWVLFFFTLTVLVARNNVDFANVFFVSTPDLVLVMILVAVSAYAVKLGMEVILRFSELMVPWAVITFLLLVIFVIPLVDNNQSRPMLIDGISPVLWGTVLAFSFPVGEAVLLVPFITGLRLVNSRQPLWLFAALLLAGGILALRTYVAVGVLGAAETSTQLFPLYSALRQIDLFGIIQRVDFLIIAVFATTAYIKLFVCFYVTTSGLGSLLKIQDYRILVFPVAIVLTAFIHLGTGSIFDLLDFNVTIWPVWSGIFFLVLPGLLTLVAVVKTIMGKKNRQKK